MITQIASESLTVEVSRAGAELQSIRTRDGHEYLWQGDPAYWSGRSPVLFPIIGGLLDGVYELDGQTYSLENHGGTRRREFDLAASAPDSVRYTLGENETSLAGYPFRFGLEIGYAVRGRELTVTWQVANQDDRDLPFSIGAHPAFRCPLEPGLDFTDYHLEFETSETADRHLKDDDLGVLTGATEPFLQDRNRFALSYSMFDTGAVILTGLRSSCVTLKSDKGARQVTVRFPGFPWLGFWTPPGKRAPFVCIEPWHGIDSTLGDPPHIWQKAGIRRLAPGQTFSTSYQIQIG